MAMVKLSYWVHLLIGIVAQYIQIQQSSINFYCQSTTDLVALPIESSSSVDVKTLVADVIDTVYDSDDEDALG